MSIHCSFNQSTLFLGTPSNFWEGEQKSDWVAARMEARLLGTWLPTLINLGSVTVSDWFLLALSLPLYCRGCFVCPRAFFHFLSPSFSSCASKVIHLGDLSAPSIDPNDNATDKNRGQVGRGALISLGITQGVRRGGTWRA